MQELRKQGRIPKGVGNKVAVLGLGESGFHSALALIKLGFTVFATDKSESMVLRERIETLRMQGGEAECGAHTMSKVLAADWILISPGIPPQSEIYKAAVASKKPLFSEIEVASWFCPTKNIVAVTGSCGKTTTVTLIQRILTAAGREVILCGNIGNPWIGELGWIKADSWVVLEVSSFQLKHCRTFKPFIGVLLNIHANHLDWHPDMKDYAGAKYKIFENMTAADWMIVQAQDEKEYGPVKSKAHKLHLKASAEESVLESAARQVSEILDISVEIPRKVFAAFEGLEHRLEKFWEKNGVLAVNDSKSTTPASLVWALNRQKDKSAIIIAGGRVKTKSFAECLPALRKKAKKVIVIGEARELMAQEWKELNPEPAASLEAACQSALAAASKGDVILFSPACSSFDMFKSYIDRGNQFKQTILKLAAQK